MYFVVALTQAGVLVGAKTSSLCRAEDNPWLSDDLHYGSDCMLDWGAWLSFVCALLWWATGMMMVLPLVEPLRVPAGRKTVPIDLTPHHQQHNPRDRPNDDDDDENHGGVYARGEEERRTATMRIAPRREETEITERQDDAERGNAAPSMEGRQAQPLPNDPQAT